ncbi:MAG TPA: glycoside hydrolase family 75 protein, partial [Chthoniobacterales bacterium]|nr:glycoside hydrolase family 75 protein [Chthoniobacterales bacterium]
MAKLSTLRRLVVLLAAIVFGLILYRWISQERLQYFAPREEQATPTPEPSPTRPPAIGGKLETGRLFSGITLHATVEPTPGADATTERVDPESYVLELKLKPRIPTPNRTIEELAKVNPKLPELLPALSTMLPTEPVSPLFAQLYETKIQMLRANLSRLDVLLTRHNFFDCQTILQLQHPQTHRKALLLQADMDVDADGSDGDRMTVGTGAPTNFKPFTSYRWAKKTSKPNPYLAATQEKLKRAEDEFAAKTTTADRKRDLRNAITQLRAEVTTLQKYSFLIGTTDPYIVIPGAFAHEKDGARTGDYALVIVGDGIYPAIIGDIGPNDKVGEASFRIAKEINPQSTPYSRPVSELKAT